MDKVRPNVLKGITATRLPVVPDEAEIATLVSRVISAKADDSENFAFVVGRNWAISRARHLSFVQRRMTEQAVRQAAEAEEQREFETRREEARVLIERLNPQVKPSQRLQLQMVWWRVFEGKSADEVAALLPHTAVDCRVKRLQRGRTLLMIHASPELRDYLSFRVPPSGGLSKTPLPVT